MKPTRKITIPDGKHPVSLAKISHGVKKGDNRDSLLLSFLVEDGVYKGFACHILVSFAKKTAKDNPMPQSVIRSNTELINQLGEAIDHPIPYDCFDYDSETLIHQAIKEELQSEIGRKLFMEKSTKPNPKYPKYPYINYRFEKAHQANTAPSPMLQQALQYAEHGFSVLPIGDNKRPLISFADKPALTPEEIREIWTQHPTANIALRTDKFFVIDVDRHNGVDGMEAIRALGHDEWFKNTLMEKTASGGYHFFFQKPQNVKITQKIGLLKGVDLKAHVNNYVVVAPSKTAKGQYKWLNHAIMQPAPEGLLQLIQEKTAPSTQPIQLHSYYKSNPQKQNGTARMLDTIANGLGEAGGRNDKLASLTGALLYRNIDIDTTTKLVTIANDNTPDKLPVSEVERTVNSMIKRELRRREAA